MKREGCKHCGIISLGQTIHKKNCLIIKKYGYLKVIKLYEKKPKT